MADPRVQVNKMPYIQFDKIIWVISSVLTLVTIITYSFIYEYNVSSEVNEFAKCEVTLVIVTLNYFIRLFCLLAL